MVFATGASLRSSEHGARRRHVGPPETAVDAYSGERLALVRASGAPLLRAVAASAAVPGLFAPQPVLDRRCMDGGVSARASLVAGTERALVFPLAGALLEPRLTIQPDSTEREIAELRAAGTAVEGSQSDSARARPEGFCRSPGAQ